MMDYLIEFGSKLLRAQETPPGENPSHRLAGYAGEMTEDTIITKEEES